MTQYTCTKDIQMYVRRLSNVYKRRTFFSIFQTVGTIFQLFKSFSSLSQDDIRGLILNASNVSCQLDPIPTYLPQDCCDVLCPIITKMVNMSLEEGRVPENWKLALLKPILKKAGMDLVFENFRPVNNLPFVAKVTEKAVSSQLLNHCNENAPLPVSQSAYRQCHSTETALLKVQNDILINMDNGEVTLLVMLDMSAAFDTIDHNILIDILKNDFGVVDNALKWFRSYLANRKQHVVIDRCKSSEFMAATGVPQGSCLGPVLFLLYVSGLLRLSLYICLVIMLLQTIHNCIFLSNLRTPRIRSQLLKQWMIVLTIFATG